MNTDNWLVIKWMGGRFDGVIYDINIPNIVEKPSFQIGQQVTLRKIKGAGQVKRA